jgi:hypothetical protein
MPLTRESNTYFPVFPDLSSLSADMKTFNAKFSIYAAPAASAVTASLNSSTFFIYTVTQYQLDIPYSRTDPNIPVPKHPEVTSTILSPHYFYLGPSTLSEHQKNSL